MGKIQPTKLKGIVDITDIQDPLLFHLNKTIEAGQATHTIVADNGQRQPYGFFPPYRRIITTFTARIPMLDDNGELVRDSNGRVRFSQKKVKYCGVSQPSIFVDEQSDSAIPSELAFKNGILKANPHDTNLLSVLMIHPSVDWKGMLSPEDYRKHIETYGEPLNTTLEKTVLMRDETAVVEENYNNEEDVVRAKYMIFQEKDETRLKAISEYLGIKPSNLSDVDARIKATAGNISRFADRNPKEVITAITDDSLPYFAAVHDALLKGLIYKTPQGLWKNSSQQDVFQSRGNENSTKAFVTFLSKTDKGRQFYNSLEKQLNKTYVSAEESELNSYISEEVEAIEELTAPQLFDALVANKLVLKEGEGLKTKYTITELSDEPLPKKALISKIEMDARFKVRVKELLAVNAED